MMVQAASAQKMIKSGVFQVAVDGELVATLHDKTKDGIFDRTEYYLQIDAISFSLYSIRYDSANTVQSIEVYLMNNFSVCKGRVDGVYCFTLNDVEDSTLTEFDYCTIEAYASDGLSFSYMFYAANASESVEQQVPFVAIPVQDRKLATKYYKKIEKNMK